MTSGNYREGTSYVAFLSRHFKGPPEVGCVRFKSAKSSGSLDYGAQQTHDGLQPLGTMKSPSQGHCSSRRPGDPSRRLFSRVLSGQASESLLAPHCNSTCLFPGYKCKKTKTCSLGNIWKMQKHIQKSSPRRKYSKLLTSVCFLAAGI